MATIDRDRKVFDPTDVTSKIDFSKARDLTTIRALSVLITGGATGLGAAIVRGLCAQGACVTIADVNVEAGEELVAELMQDGSQAFFIKTDVTDWTSQTQAFKAAIANSGRQAVDLVIPCAGTPGVPVPLQPHVSLDEDPPPPQTITIDVTLTGVYYTTVLALHYFRLKTTSPHPHPQSKKHIIFIGSLASYLEVPPIGDYNAAKFGVRGLWKSLRREIAELGIRSNLIAPTFLPTVQTQQVIPKLEAKGGRFGKLEDAVDAVLLLASDEAVDSRAIAVGADGNFDLRDDYEGHDAGVEVLEYFKSGAFGGGMQTFKEVLEGRSWG
ncbi:MAG: hypothetical protein M1828_005919 [Chrysothrix sp. TS-e1954]|nr:MAG: hypothetical protein M1828_005919 [Chrysothrix sp. TS-e1954]